MVIMASGIAHGHVRTTMTTATQHVPSHSPATGLTKTCSIGLQCKSLILEIRVMVN